MKQISLLPSGMQKWFDNVLYLHSSRLIYCSTLSIYIFENEQLERILTGHVSTITCISISKFDPDILASSSNDKSIRIWEVPSGKCVKIISTLSTSFKPTFLDWSPFHKYELFVSSSVSNDIRVYNYQTGCYKSLHLKRNDTILLVRCNKYRKDSNICVSRNVKKEQVSCHFFSPNKVLKSIPLYNRKATNLSNIKWKNGNIILDVKFDLLSENYFLVLYSNNEMCLYDMHQPGFALPFRYTNAASFDWTNVPGNFITGDVLSGIVRVWNVSDNCSALRTLKISTRAFRKIVVDNDRVGYSLTSGEVGVYDIKANKSVLNTPPGHVETIFACKYSSIDCNVFATSSYDSTIKIWDTRAMKCVADLYGVEVNSVDTTVIIYSLAWHPKKNMIAGSLGNGYVWIWDVETTQVVQKSKLHSNAVYNVRWNQRNPQLLASTSKDKNCVVFKMNGKKVKVYKHPSVVFGVDWSTMDENVLCTGCHDNIIRVFNVSLSSDAPIKKLIGHKDKVYNVVFHPLFKNILMSGSNDKTVRVWNTANKESIILKGHKSNVRALSWNSEIPYICISGSWDGTIRVWDTRRQKCIKIVADHHADVYGLDYHKNRPFVYGSTSRDTTIRFFSLQPLLEKMYLKCLINLSFKGVLNKNVCDESQHRKLIFSPDNIDIKNHKLYGNVSLNVDCKLKASNINISEKYRLLFDYLYLPFGSKDLTLLLSSIYQDSNSVFLEQGNETKFIHSKFLPSSLETKSVALENEKAKSGGGVGSKKKEDVIVEQLDLYLSMNKIQNYCESLIEIGKWEKAMSIAPYVSYDYWKQLCMRYSSFLIKKNNENSYNDIPLYLLCSNDIDKMVDFYLSRNDFEKALFVCLSLSSTPYSSCEKDSKKKRDDNNIKKKIKMITKKEANSFLKKSQPFHAGCCYLRINDFSQAIRCLVKGNELLHAYSLVKILNKEEENDNLYFKIAQMCSKHRLFEEGNMIINRVSDEDMKMMYVSQIENITFQELEKVYIKLGFQSPSFYKSEAEILEKEKKYLEATRFYALGKDYTRAVILGNSQFQFYFKQKLWDWSKIHHLYISMQCCKVIGLKNGSAKNEFYGNVNFVGANIAIWKGYYSILPFMIMNSRVCYKEALHCGIPQDYLDYLLCLAYYYNNNSKESLNFIKQVNLSKCSQKIINSLNYLKDLIMKKKEFSNTDMKNIIIPSYSSLPIKKLSGDRLMSYITGVECKPPLVKLKKEINKRDSKKIYVISLAEALMWKDVNAFSPLNNGDFLRF